MADNLPLGFKMKYAQIERERRFLLADLPDDLPVDYHQIVDRYIVGTRLRLRQMKMPSGEVIEAKLGQKFALDDAPTDAVMTNIYLNATEYQTLLALDAVELQKRRFRYEWFGRFYSIDVFDHALSGLILAEIEGKADELAALPLPNFAVADVTNDPFFRGGNLITLELSQLQYELQNYTRK